MTTGFWISPALNASPTRPPPCQNPSALFKRMARPIFRSIVSQIPTVAIAAVWIFHGGFSKLLNGIPRHQLIVARILGEDIATSATYAVGIMELMLGVWALSERNRRACALAQTLAIASMNALEILFASDLLISPIGMLALNAIFLAVVWSWATRASATATQSSQAATDRTR